MKQVSGNQQKETLTKYFYIFIVFSFVSVYKAQTKTADPNKPKEPKLIKIMHGDLSFDQSKSNAKLLTNKPVFEHDGAILNCDTAWLYDKENRMDASGNVLITKGDSITVTGGKLQYDGKTKMATLQNSVTVTEKDMVLTTNLLTFDVGNSIANYYDGGKIVNKENTLVSKNGHYYSATKDLAFHYDVVLTNPDYTMKSDTLRYNTITKTAYFLGPSIIISKTDYIYCENGWYDTDKEKAQFSVNALLVTSQQKLTGDSLFYDRNAKTGRAFRNVRLIDTSQKSIIFGGYAEFKQEKSEALITVNPIYARIVNNDTLFIAADTLYHRDIDSVDNFLNAYHHVKVFKTDLQAMSDSASLNTKDSLLQLFKNPMLWSTRSQATSKLIKVYIGKSTVNGFKLESNAFLIQQVDSLNTDKFNQLTGRSIEGLIRNDTVRKVVIIGNAEALYYVKNKEALAGLNKTTTSEINMWFKNDEIDRVTLKPQVDGVVTPMKDVDPESTKIKGFNWQYEKRPKSKQDLHVYKKPEKKAAENKKRVAASTKDKKRSIKGQTINDTLTGLFIITDQKKKVIEEVNLDKGYLNGKRSVYIKEKLQATYNYTRGCLDEFTEFSENDQSVKTICKDCKPYRAVNYKKQEQVGDTLLIESEEKLIYKYGFISDINALLQSKFPAKD